MCGFWFLDNANPDWAAPQDFLDFLEAGEPPGKDPLSWRFSKSYKSKDEDEEERVRGDGKEKDRINVDQRFFLGEVLLLPPSTTPIPR